MAEIKKTFNPKKGGEQNNNNNNDNNNNKDNKEDTQCTDLKNNKFPIYVWLLLVTM